MPKLSKMLTDVISHVSKVGISLDKNRRGKVKVTGNIYAIVKLEDGIWNVEDFTRDYSKERKDNTNGK